MRFDRLSISAFAASALLFACSRSQVDAEPALSPEIVKSVLDWSQCRAPKVSALIPSERTADSIVDQALLECVDIENEAVRVWEQVYGSGSGSQIADLKVRWRDSMIESVNAVRSGGMPTDVYAAWGLCVGSNLPNAIPTNADASALVELAIAACSMEFRQLREQIASQNDEQTATSQATFLRDELRKMAIAQIEKDRRH